MATGIASSLLIKTGGRLPGCVGPARPCAKCTWLTGDATPRAGCSRREASEEVFKPTTGGLDVEEPWEVAGESGALVSVDMAEAISLSFSSESCERML